MKFILIGTWKGDHFREYVTRAEKTLTEHAGGYAGVQVIARYYAIGERMLFSICEAESGVDLMKVVTPYLDIIDIKVIPVLDGLEALNIWRAG